MSKTIKAVTAGYGIRVVEKLLPPIPRAWVLVRVLYASWGGIEDAIASGRLWVEPGRVLGSDGVGVVVERGVGVPSVLGPGVVVAVSRVSYGDNGRVYSLPGVEYDGWLAEYTVLPASILSPLPAGECKDEPLCGVITSAAIAWAAAKELKSYDKPVILGCGVTGVMTGLVLAWEGRRVTIYTSGCPWLDSVKRLGLNVEHVSRLHEGFDAIFVTTLDPYDVRIASQYVNKTTLVLLHPVYAYIGGVESIRGIVKLLERFPAESGLYLLKQLDEVTREALFGFATLESIYSPREKPALLIQFR